jgi:hypothetical protein
MDISMIWVHPIENKDILDETVLLAKRNMAIKNRGGRKMLTIKPTPREPSAEEIQKQNEEYWANQWKLINEFNKLNKTKALNTRYPYTMNDIMSVNKSPKLEKLFPELVVHDVSFNWKR